MKDNYHEYPAMVELAKSLSRHWRIGAPWLYLSACGTDEKNAEIAAQRLPPSEVIALDKPNLSYEEEHRPDESCSMDSSDDRLFAGCIEARRDFHVDPYGKYRLCMSLCHPDCVYDLRSGSVADAWENFVPKVRDMRPDDTEFPETCRKCPIINLCLWCPAHADLETGRLDGQVEYFCRVAHARAEALGYTVKED